MTGPFDYNDQPTDSMIFDMKTLRSEFKKLHQAIILLSPESRERSLAITKLEESAFWANKAISHFQEQQS